MIWGKWRFSYIVTRNLPFQNMADRIYMNVCYTVRNLLEYHWTSLLQHQQNYFLLLHLNHAGLDQIHWSHKILCSRSGMHLYQPENSNSISGSQVENQYRWYYYFLNTKTEFQITVMLAVLWIRDAQALHLPMEAFPPKGYLIDWKISVFLFVSLIRLIGPSREPVSFGSKID